MNNKEKKIIDTVDRLGDATLDFTKRLVAEPSTLGNEAGAVAVMEKELKKMGFSTALIPLENSSLKTHPGFAPVPWSLEGRNAVVGTLEPEGTGGRSALFNGHLDVVPVGNSNFWNRDPFVPVVDGDWLYGRGAGDMKSGVAAMTYAVHAIQQAGFSLCAPMTVEGVIEEECSGNGAVACLAAGYDADAVLIPEPFGPTILTDQVGVLWFKVRLCGRPGHVLQAPAGINAIEKCYVLIRALHELETQLNETKIPSAYADLAHPLNLNVGIVKGGEWPSTVPEESEFHARLSYFPGTDFTEVCRRIETTIADAAAKDEWLRDNPPTISFYGFRSDGHSVSRELPALGVLDDCHRSLTGETAASYISKCTTDLRAFHWFGRGQATCYGPEAENIHGIDERVSIKSIMHTARAYALFLARWCLLCE